MEKTPQDGFYVGVRVKFVLSLLLALGWVGFSVWLAQPWIHELGAHVGFPLAWIAVTGVALLPGLASAFVLAGLVVDQRPQYPIPRQLPPVTILVAAYNEQLAIHDTLESIVAQIYPGQVETIVIDDGSTDDTPHIVDRFIREARYPAGHRVRLLRAERNAGKARALNLGLAQAKTEVIVTVDGDSYLYGNALANLVGHLSKGPVNTAAVAGTVMVRNSRKNFLTRLQEWDYFHGIAIVKRTQSLFQGTLVAQGAFSAYSKTALDQLGGWHDTVGEDIVLTWGLLGAGYRVGYAENAFVFTNVPENYGAFYRQRKRWARGMVEAFKRFPGILVQPKMNTPFIYFNVAFPYIDFCYLFVFLPGVLAAIFFQWYLIAGLLTLLLLPLALVINLVMYFRQRAIFERNGLQIRRNLLGLVTYVLCYQLFLTPPSLAGYLVEVLGRRKTW